MGFQGTLDSVNLGDIFQTLSMNSQTGTMCVTARGQQRRVWFTRGNIALCDIPRSDGLPVLLRTLVARNLLQQKQAEQIFFRCNNTRQPLRDLIVASNLVRTQDLDDIATMLLEDAACELFEWHEGEFTFVDGDPTPELNGPHVVALGEIPLQTSAVVMEATRRQDEWQRIRDAVPDSNDLYVIDNHGRENLASIETDPEMLRVLRYLDGKHRLDQIAEAVGLSRFDIHAIVAQLVMADVVRLRSIDEILVDATSLRAEDHPHQACNLLLNALKQDRSPAIILPLAEMSAELREIPRAVELYLELVQHCQDEEDAEHALLYLDRVIELSPDDPELRLDRANLLITLDQLEAAADAFINAAGDYLTIRDTDAAIDCCHRARDIRPRAPEPHRLLARAYLLDGQTDNAVVEYKSLWHALLTDARPRKALTQLEAILAQDCKYDSVREQVLNHARGSEAVKTASAMRLLIYVVIVIVLIGTGFLAKTLIEEHVVLRNAQEQVATIADTFSRGAEDFDYRTYLTALEDMRDDYSDREILASIESLRERLLSARTRQAEELLTRCRQEIAAEAYMAAEELLRDLERRFVESAHAQLPELREQIAYGRARRAISDELAQAEETWANDRWDNAIAQLTRLRDQTQDAPTRLQQELKTRHAEWTTTSTDAKALFSRAERIQLKQGKKAALTAFERAAAAQGERFAKRARERLIEVEKLYATELAQGIGKAARNGDADQTFAQLDALVALSEHAHSTYIAEILGVIQLPYALEVDSHHTVLTITSQLGQAITVRAPQGQQGAWVHQLEYPATGALTVRASRSGFTSVDDLRIDATRRRLGETIALNRGPLWRVDLPAIPAAIPAESNHNAVIGLRNNTLLIVDPASGAFRSITLGEDLGGLRGAPQVFRGVAYVILGDQLLAIDIDTRTRLWSWPPEDDPSVAASFSGRVWVQEHELIQNEIMVFAGTSSGQLLTFAIQDGDQVTLYPRTRLNWGITGPIFAYSYEGIHSTVFTPAGNHLVAFDSSTISEQSPLKQRFVVETRGDIVTRPLRARVAGQDAILISDTGGSIFAIDADPSVHGAPVQSIGSWPLESGIESAPALARDGRFAFVATQSGKVIALDLERPGQLAWTFPESGRLGTINGRPAVGTQGLYIADGNGMLTCIDAETGRKRWDYDLGAATAAPPVLINDRLLVCTDDAILHCFEEGAR